MIILIDAYNLFKTVSHAQFIEHRQRIKFLQMFERYAQKRLSNKIILVFDGGSNEMYEAEKDHPHISLLYSGFKESADDVIKNRIIAFQGLDVLLVTCDRELRRYAQQYQTESIGSMEFYYILQKMLESNDKQEKIVAQSIHKMSTNQDDHLDALMEFGSRKLIIKEQDKEIKVTTSSVKELRDSKKDKKLLKKIAKI